MLTRESLDDIAEMSKALKSGENPRDAKVKLAKAVVTMYHSAEAANVAEEYFVNTFAKKQVPDEMPELEPKDYKLIPTLVEAGIVSSTSEARRLISEGGIKVNGEKVTPLVIGTKPNGKVRFYDLEKGDLVEKIKPGDVVQKGKRFFVKII